MINPMGINHDIHVEKQEMLVKSVVGEIAGEEQRGINNEVQRRANNRSMAQCVEEQ